MNKLFLSLLTIMMAVAMNAQTKAAKADLADNQQLVGYYLSDKINNKGFGLPEWGENDHCRAAIKLTADMLKPYIGKKIVSIRFGLSVKLDKSRVFITELTKGYEGNDVVAKDVETTTTGWNVIQLDNPYSIEKDKDILVGFDFQQKTRKKGAYYAAECYPLSIVNEGITYMPVLIYANNGYGDEWHEIGTQTGNFSIQVVVEGNVGEYSVTAYDFNIVAGEPGKDTTAKVTITNNGKSEVKTIGYTVTVDGTTAAEQTATFDEPVAPGANGSFYAVIPATASYGKKTVSIEITKVNGNENTADSRTANGYMGVAKDFFQRNVVIEEFTTEECGNCPRVAEYLHKALKQLNKERVFAIARHSAYGTDWLTQPCDEEMVAPMFDGEQNAFAPAMTINRDCNAIPDEDGTKRGNVFMPMVYAQIQAYVNNQLGMTANAQLEMEVMPNTSGTLAKVVIKGMCNEAFDTENCLLSLFMTEDSIKPQNQNGAPEGYKQMHVIRYYNNTWGDKVEWNADNTFTATYDIDLFPEWNKRNLQFVAFLNKHNDKDFSDNKIYNSTGVNYKNITSGIDSILQNDSLDMTARYTVDGIKTGAPVKGLNIVRLSDGRTVKVAVK